MEIIIILLIIFVLWPIIRVVWAAYKLKRGYESAMRNARQAAREANRASRPAGWATPRGPKAKVVNQNEGEYVEWEEITVSQEATSTDGNAKSARRTKVSSYITERISDADWEDIPS